MRQLGRLLIEINSYSNSNSTATLEDMLDPDHFDQVVNAAESVAGTSTNSEGIRVHEIPSLALRLGHNLSKCAQIKRGCGIRKKDEKKIQSAEYYMKLHETEWQERISSIALASMKTCNILSCNRYPKGFITFQNINRVQFMTTFN